MSDTAVPPKLCDRCGKPRGPAFVITREGLNVCHGCHREIVAERAADACEAVGQGQA